MSRVRWGLVSAEDDDGVVGAESGWYSDVMAAVL